MSDPASLLPSSEFQYKPFVRRLDDGMETLTCTLEGVRCGSCIQRIEDAVSSIPGVIAVRANATTHRMRLVWQAGEVQPETLLQKISALGFKPTPFNPDQMKQNARQHKEQLLLALGVAAFGMVMLMGFSYSVWAGLALDMGDNTRTLMHWLSALIALPVSAVAGRPFFTSAWKGLRHGQVNMDGPISFAVLMTLAASVAETVRGGEHVYYDAAISLLFFLLIGRVLEAGIRQNAGSAVDNLLALSGGIARKILPDGSILDIRDDELRLGDAVLVASGNHFPADGLVEDHACEVDESLITGETRPRLIKPGEKLVAGTLNLGQAVKMRVTAVDKDTRLAQIAELMERAEQHKGRHQILADRFAVYYAPAVFILSLLGLLVWRFGIGASWHEAVMIAVAVLVVTCPCAVGLATPVVMVGTVGQLMRKGIIVKSSDSLERLAEINGVVFDKTGTLTHGKPELQRVSSQELSGDFSVSLKQAASLTCNSTHPLAKALTSSCPTHAAPNVKEHPGLGLSQQGAEGETKLGSSRFCNISDEERQKWDTGAEDKELQELWFRIPGKTPVRFTFRDEIRGDAKQTVMSLKKSGLDVFMLSGDRANVTEKIAKEIGIEEWQGQCLPEDKVLFLQKHRLIGYKTLMVGDGINDAPALAAAHVSMSPSSASDISQVSADMIFQGEDLASIKSTYELAKRSMRLVKQNLGFAVLYNIITVPLALAGGLTPLIAALLMSSSSIVVMLNALRIRSA